MMEGTARPTPPSPEVNVLAPWLLAALLAAPATPVATATPAGRATPAAVAPSARVTPQPSPTPSLDQQVHKAVRAEVEAQVPTGSRARMLLNRAYFKDGVYYYEMTVTDWYRDLLLLPDYGRAVRTVKGFGVPRGGQSGSPSFDTFTQQYWWE
jgi:hypothetical protein